MKINVDELPFMNKVIYQYVMSRANGNITEFARLIDVSQQRISRLFYKDSRSGKYPTVSQSIKDAVCEAFGLSEMELTARVTYPDLEEGKITNGSVAKDAPQTEYGGYPRVVNDDYNNGKPFYDVPFTMGYDLPFNDNTSNPTCMIDFRPYNKCDFWCRATGDSMYPTISDGDIVAVKRVYDFASSVISNDIYAIVLCNDLRAIKRLVDKGDTFILVSDNKEYEPQIVNKSDVRFVYRVMGSLKMKMF